MSPRLVIVGAPGAGKTTVGRLLAERWQVPFVDSDLLVEAEAGRPVADVFVVDGEDAFRAMERGAVASALVDHDGVLALGGGAILNADTRTELRDQPGLLLTVGAAAAASRIGLNRDRPLLMGNVRGTLVRLMAERSALYDEVATWTVATDDLDAADVADRVDAVMTEGAT
jgi:shikimate kinase